MNYFLIETTTETALNRTFRSGRFKSKTFRCARFGLAVSITGHFNQTI